MDNDRRIHARTANGNLVVRLDRAGKWYVETGLGTRSLITIQEAVQLATEPGSYVYFDQPGGTSFDAKVRAAVSA